MRDRKTIDSYPVVILCGGKGTRMREDGEVRPKPMVDVGGKPILWHIMKIYAHYGLTEFLLPLGFKGAEIRRYFNQHRTPADWKISFFETGLNTLKGARLKHLEPYLTKENFHLTYGDGVSSINLHALQQFHITHGKLASVTAVRPPSRFGELVLKGTQVRRFVEKPQLSSGTINGGFFVFRKEFLKHLTTKADCDLEFGALQVIARKSQLRAFKHPGFWQCMDTVRERDYLNRLWANDAPWKTWES